MADRKVPAWTKPRMKIYEYNREFGGKYYQPMLEYIEQKETQGVFFPPRSTLEKVHLPEPAELSRSSFSSSMSDVDYFLENSYKKQIRESNQTSVHTLNAAVRQSKQQSHLNPILPCTMVRNHYIKEIARLRNSTVYPALDL
ncbi:uncharacterized protein LOC111701688 [Eurytemora carolleeae]|uniref:uncharacterized protein LOC111701688 n=1 Tax=Eurytemora carolleeae TaxID=1294199 RepID=UPI000C76CADB|nr:uncharacterized protein LOC111701688 [Eurytemora carolleeae]|eukprot:XP_023328861.1 uncharacterized protein LOC111701688 [Eurytemora affinis]